MAWEMAFDRGIETMRPDGPGHYLSFSAESWNFPDGDTLKGLYIQSFNQQTILFVLPDLSILPPYPRFIASPFLEVLLASGHILPGGENLRPLNIRFRGGGGTFTRALMRGLALYGIPLTDPMPVPDEEGESWREVQRFSRGWLQSF